MVARTPVQVDPIDESEVAVLQQACNLAVRGRVSTVTATSRNPFRFNVCVMTIARKLQIPAAGHVVVLGRPDGVDLEIPTDSVVTTSPADAVEASAVIAFVVSSAELDAVAGPALSAARDDRLAWIAYPKSRQLGTDLNRDVLAALAAERGLQPVRQVAVDSVWSALRFRPA